MQNVFRQWQLKVLCGCGAAYVVVQKNERIGFCSKRLKSVVQQQSEQIWARAGTVDDGADSIVEVVPAALETCYTFQESNL